MTKEEYDKGIEIIERRSKLDKRKLAQDYALSNNPHGIGDIITDGYDTIKIESIKWSFQLRKYPMCAYSGPRLKKNLEPYKNGQYNTIFQCNLTD